MFERFINNGSKNISPDEVKKRLDENKNMILLDVRSPEEYAEKHIPKSKSLPIEKVAGNISEITGQKDAEIIVYCLSGGRASKACAQLNKLGYTNVYNMGGIQNWPYETVKGH